MGFDPIFGGVVGLLLLFDGIVEHRAEKVCVAETTKERRLNGREKNELVVNKNFIDRMKITPMIDTHHLTHVLL